ncbi:MAG: response regulator transcription factor [Gammaproteobacteria bacterium]|nr:response regulator transcription factor [Gammaproteobacteria bacterium]MBL4898902.1 response regulator transcription factor [Colwellia sp.]
MRLLLVEDNRDLAEGLVVALRAEGFVVSHGALGADAIKQLDQFDPDIIVLDLGLPDMDGLDVLKFVRKAKPQLPTLVLTARSGLDDKVNALDNGADDYLAKPFEMKELLARLRVMGRRLNTAITSQVCIGGVVLDTVAHTLSVDGEEVRLPKKEYMTLKILMEEAGRVKTKSMLENNLYEWGETIGSNAIEVHISNLRKKLPQNFIQTIRGIGYTVSPSG